MAEEFIIKELSLEDIDRMIAERDAKGYINYFDYTLIPIQLMQMMMAYAYQGIPLEDEFLQAIFANDLFKATGYADDENIRILPVYVKWIYNEAPCTCHGSYEIVQKWINRHTKAE